MTAINRLVIIVILAVTIGLGIHQSRRATIAHRQARTAQEQLAPLAGQAEQLIHERDQAVGQIATLRDEVERLNQNTPELLRLRGEVAQLRQNALRLSNQLAVAQERVSRPITSGTMTGHDLPIFTSSALIETSRSWSTQDHVPQPGDAQKPTIYGSPTNGTLLIAWQKHWYPAEILESRNGQHLIRYTGYGSNWDEWVSTERMAVYDAERPAAQR